MKKYDALEFKPANECDKRFALNEKNLKRCMEIIKRIEKEKKGIFICEKIEFNPIIHEEIWKLFEEARLLKKSDKTKTKRKELEQCKK